jgi:putative transcriptional regulator
MSIKLHLSKIMGERRIRARKLAEQTGMMPTTLSMLYNEKVEGIRFETLDKLCAALECSVGDLLEYVPDAPKKAAAKKR